MNAHSLARRSLRFYWRTHLGVAAGAAVASAVLVGALVVGDSVRGSLEEMALARLGDARLALAAEDRFFRAELAGEVAPLLGKTAPLLRLRGIAAGEAGDGARVSGVQVLGVDRRFWELGPAGDLLNGQPPETVVLNERLARQLQAAPGDVVLLRIDKPGIMPRDAPLSSDADASITFRLTVGGIASDGGFGRFSLQADQLPPYNAFVALSWLQEKLGRAGRANVLLVGGSGKGATDLADAAAALRESFQLADADLELRELPEAGAPELRSRRVFLDDAVARAAVGAAPGALEILTYFVNELRVGDRATPYSIVSALGEAAPGTPAAKLLPPDMADDEIVINSWLADDLDAQPDETLELRYYVLGPMRSLEERAARFRIRGVVPIEGAAADRELMPIFPGLAGVDNCRDWEPGVPIDLDRIRKSDEQYWNRYRGTPKAFVTLPAAQRLWANRYGGLTALRWRAGSIAKARLEEAIRRGLDPAAAGLFFVPVREQALAASRQSLNFGQLFLGLSFFLIVAALLLMGLLFVFGVEQRSEEIGTLLAVGFGGGRVRRLLLAEGAVLALVGTAVGVVAGVLYTRAVLYGLSTLWRGAVASSTLSFHVKLLTLAVGAGAALAAAGATMWGVLRRQVRRSPRALLDGLGPEVASASRPARDRIALWVALACGAGAAAIVAMAGVGTGEKAPAAFFAAGGLLLSAGIALSLFVLSKLARASRPARLTLGELGLRNSSRRRLRSLAVVGLLACGSFLVVAVGANRRDPRAGAQRRSAGTGGFAFFGQSALGVFRDLNSPAGREAFALEPAALEGVRVVHMRLREGDDASCLNLNRPQRPRLLGVDPAELASRGAFTFLKTVARAEGEDAWMLLARPQADGVIPAIGDDPTVTWALGKSVGETLPYVDEKGRPFQVRIVGSIAGSILQGSLLISEEHFQRLFPSSSGYRAFLVDCSPARAAAVRKELTRALRDVGLELTAAAERLAAFNAVENTYLSIFQALGGLGLLLGSVGLGVVVLRNVMERRGELALLRAVGFSRGALRRLLLSEHWGLLVLGLACGVVSALVAVLPALRSPGAQIPFASLGLTLLAVAASGAAWTYLATVLAVRGPLLEALRNE